MPVRTDRAIKAAVIVFMAISPLLGSDAGNTIVARHR